MLLLLHAIRIREGNGVDGKEERRAEILEEYRFKVKKKRV